MATGGLYGSSGTGALIAQPGSESSGLYGNSTSFGGTYFEWFIFQTSETQPATPTGGTWNFTTNVNTPPTGWSSTPPSNPLNTVWVSIAIVNSKNTAPLVWSVPGKFAFSSGLPILFGNGAPNPGDGQSDQLYIQLDTAPQTIWAKETGTWTRLTGSTLYVDLTSNQTIAGTKTFSSQIQGSISGNASNVTGTVAITNGGTGATTAGSARAALGAAASGANSDITSLSGLTTALSLSQGGTAATTAPDARTNLGLGSAAVLNAGVANGVATLDAGGTVPLSQIPASIQGGVSYQGTWNATTNTPTLTSSVGTKGYYYVVSVAGSTNLNGITSWNIGDWAIYNGTAWEKIDNTDAVTSVNGYTGTVVLTASDISGLGTIASQNANAVAITGGTINGTSIGATTPSTGVFTTLTVNNNLTVNDNTTLGSSNSDTTTFNGRIASEFTPSTANTYDLGRNSHEWRNLYLTGTANISALTASGTVTLSGGTANGVAYLNGSKVLTTGSALTFDGNTFGVNSGATGLNTNFNSTSVNGVYVRFQNSGTSIGDVGSGAQIVGGSAGDFGLTSRSGSLIFGQNSAEGMRLTSTGLGIGTSSPAYKLDVRGGVISAGNGTIAGGISYSTRVEMGAISNHNLGFIVNNTTQMLLDTSGRLGVGTTTLAGRVSSASDVYASFVAMATTTGTGRTVNALTVTDLGATSFANGVYSALSHQWVTDGTERARIDSIGNFGLGTTAPNNGGNNGRWLTLSAVAGSTYSGGLSFAIGGTNQCWVYQDTDNLLAFQGAGSNAGFKWMYGGTERARIDSSGNLLVGATSAFGFGVSSIQVGGDNANGLISVRRNTTSAADQIIFYNPNGLVGRIQTSAGSTSYITSSDYRLKNTVAPMTGALAKVALLKPCTYKWNFDGSDGQGFIAHELQEVCPDAVCGAKDAVDEEGNPQYQGIDTSFLVATLTAAIQEQQALIQTLTARVQALESN